MASESSRTRNFLDDVRRRYPTAFVRKVSQLFEGGWPDCLLIINGRALWIECKVPGGSLTPLQRLTLRDIRASGADAFVAYLVSSGDRLFDVNDAPIVMAPFTTVFDYVEWLIDTDTRTPPVDVSAVAPPRTRRAARQAPSL